MYIFQMNPNSTIHVIESFSPQETPDDVKKPPPSDDELQQFMIAFGLAVRKDKGQPFMKIMQRLRKRENLENIAATCPELTRGNYEIYQTNFIEILISISFKKGTF